jgi:hypothetical protein
MRLLYFVTDSSNNHVHMQTLIRGIGLLLRSRGIEATVITDMDNCVKNSRHRHTAEDVWLLADAHSRAAAGLREFPGKKFAHLHRHRDLFYDPASILDGIFVATEWGKNRLLVNYPHFSSRVALCGYPFYPRLPQAAVPRETNFIIFNQNFSHDNLHILEVYLSGLLRQRGCRVAHLSPAAAESTLTGTPELRCLMQEGQKSGMEFVFYRSYQEYCRWLARASAMMVTVVDEPDEMDVLEAVSVGTPVLAPDHGPYPELLPPAHLYPPYHLGRMAAKALRPPQPHLPGRNFEPQHVLDVYRQAMGVA